MGDSDNPLGGIIGMVVLISVLPMILQMLSGLTGNANAAGVPPGTIIPPAYPSPFPAGQYRVAGWQGGPGETGFGGTVVMPPAPMGGTFVPRGRVFGPTMPGGMPYPPGHGRQVLVGF